MKRSLLFALLCPAIASFAQEVLYHPALTLDFGNSYDFKKPTTPYTSVRVVSHDGEKNIDGGAAEISVDIREVKTREELISQLGFSATVEYGATMMSAGVSGAKTEGLSFNDTSITWVATAKINFGRFQMINPRVTPEALSNPDRIGPTYVVQIHKGALASVVFHARHVDEQTQKNVRAALRLAARGTGYSASARAEYNTALSRINEKGDIRLLFHAQGGPGASHLERIITAGDDLIAVKEVLAKYVAEMTAANAKPIAWTVESVHNLGIRSTPAVNVADFQLKEMYRRFMDVNAVINEIDTLTKPTTSEEVWLNKFVTATVRNALEEKRSEYDRYRNELRNAGLAALNGKTAVVPNLFIDNVVWPNLPPPPVAMLLGADSKEGITVNITRKQAEPLSWGDTIGSRHFKALVLGSKTVPVTKVEVHNGNVFVPAVVQQVNEAEHDIRRICSENSIDFNGVLALASFTIDVMYEPVSSSRQTRKYNFHKVRVTDAIGRSTYNEFGFRADFPRHERQDTTSINK